MIDTPVYTATLAAVLGRARVETAEVERRCEERVAALVAHYEARLLEAREAVAAAVRAAAEVRSRADLDLRAVRVAAALSEPDRPTSDPTPPAPASEVRPSAEPAPDGGPQEPPRVPGFAQLREETRGRAGGHLDALFGPS